MKTKKILVMMALLVFFCVGCYTQSPVEKDYEPSTEVMSIYETEENEIEPVEDDMTTYYDSFVSSGITRKLGECITRSLIESTPPTEDAFNFDTWVPFWVEEGLVDEVNGGEYTKLTERQIPVKGRNFDEIEPYIVNKILDYTFMAAGDLSFETQIAVISTIFNIFEQEGVQDPSNITSLPLRMGFDDYPMMSDSDEVIDSFIADHQLDIDNVKTAIECVINDDPRVIKIPKDVTFFSTSIIDSKYSDGLRIYEADCLDGFYFYHDTEAM